jgi:hypothetical protein
MSDAAVRVQDVLTRNREDVGGAERELRDLADQQETKIRQLESRFAEDGDVLPVLRELRETNAQIRAAFEPRPPSEPGRREDPVPPDAPAQAAKRDAEEREQEQKKAAAAAQKAEAKEERGAAPPATSKSK